MKCTCIVSDHGFSGIGMGADQGDALILAGIKRQSVVVVLQKHNGLPRSIHSQFPLLFGANIICAEGLKSGDVVEESNPHEEHVQVLQGVVNVRLADQPLLHGRLGEVHVVVERTVPTIQIQAYINLYI